MRISSRRRVYPRVWRQEIRFADWSKRIMWLLKCSYTNTQDHQINKLLFLTLKQLSCITDHKSMLYITWGTRLALEHDFSFHFSLEKSYPKFDRKISWLVWIRKIHNVLSTKSVSKLKTETQVSIFNTSYMYIPEYTP